MTSSIRFTPVFLHPSSWVLKCFFYIIALKLNKKEQIFMKKNIFKSAKSIIFAVALCAVAALGALSVTPNTDSQEATIVATHPEFIEGVY